MPAPKGNKHAAKPDKDKGLSFSFRMTPALTRRVEKAAKKRKIKRGKWMVEAATEKADKERVR